MDWWDNKEKEIAKLLEILEEKKATYDDHVVVKKVEEPEIEPEPQVNEEKIRMT